jgi:hypothetical protein
VEKARTQAQTSVSVLNAPSGTLPGGLSQASGRQEQSDCASTWDCTEAPEMHACGGHAGVWWMDQAIASTTRTRAFQSSGAQPHRGAERRQAASRNAPPPPQGSAWTTGAAGRAGFPSFRFLMIRSVSSRVRPVGRGTMCGARSTLFVKRACPTTPGLVLPL